MTDMIKMCGKFRWDVFDVDVCDGLMDVTIWAGAFFLSVNVVYRYMNVVCIYTWCLCTWWSDTLYIYIYIYVCIDLHIYVVYI